MQFSVVYSSIVHLISVRQKKKKERDGHLSLFSHSHVTPFKLISGLYYIKINVRSSKISLYFLLTYKIVSLCKEEQLLEKYRTQNRSAGANMNRTFPHSVGMSFMEHLPNSVFQN